ncbi:hypothetical protein J7399_06730 [Shimia sp. R9_1]|uniref:flagellin n=1 Tax=unclassified Shimia TaxID=2630038 RepID=UPI001AD9D148|nr:MULTISPECIES: flagellin [unclassified Shimia]MBO9395114.1 hypothetical protein [Shimia sp. R9_2]MBO9407115.1 hypothetical protein [Shimia sp. R9_1]
MITSIGDMAQQMMMSRRTTSVKNDLDRLAQELASGRKSDVAASLRGDFNMLAGVERQLTVLEGFEVASNDAKVFAEVAQSSLKMIQETAGGLGNDLMSASSSGLTASVDSVAKNARNDFDAIVSALNGRAGDRALFAGTATDAGALVSSEDMMTQINAAITAAGAVTVTDIVAAVDDYFMTAGGGFETSAYVGSTNNLTPFRLNETETADYEIRADNTALRQAMRDTALAALADEPSLSLNLTEKQQLMRTVGERLLSNQDKIVEVRADLGFNQERIENAQANNSAQRSALLMTQSDLLSADSTEVAGQLQAVQVQLELVYTITARLSQLTLANYIR